MFYRPQLKALDGGPFEGLDLAFTYLQHGKD
jgi:hypothetical protein